MSAPSADDVRRQLGAQVFKILGGFELKSQFGNVPGRQISGAWPAMQVWCYLCHTCKAQMWLQLQILQMLQHLTLELYCCHWYWNCSAFTDTATVLLSLTLKLYWCNWHWNCTAVTDTESVLLSLTELYGCHWHWNFTDVTDTGTGMMGKVPQTCPKIPVKITGWFF